MTSVLIVGGAATGWATAHHLLCLAPQLDVTVIETDPALKRSSTMLSDGNVRIQFNREENIAMSIYAMECLDSFAEDMATDGYSPDPRPRKQGNLFLVDHEGEADAMAGLAVQQRLGCDSHWLDMEAIAARWPALSSDRLTGGTFGPSDGTVDISAVVDGYRRKARRAGAKLVVATVKELTLEGDRVSGVRLTDGTSMGADAVVVCAGAWSKDLLATAGVDIPVDPVMRTVYVVAGDVEGSDSLPLAFLPSGVYVITEHDKRFLIAWSTDEDPVGFDFTPASRSKFYDVIWPELVTELPAFRRLEVVRSWAGLYAQNRLDANAIIGEWPGIGGLLLATGFSGHGFQQCHAVGRHLAELVCSRPTSLDLSPLGPERILTGKPYLEHAGRII